MKKLAIIGASYLQAPLIQKAKDLGCETHVFAWAAGDVGEGMADRFYPISIVEKEEILRVCRQIGIDGICTIASDLAAVTVNYVAEQMGLPGNGMRCCEKSTNKYKMRQAFAAAGDPSPRSVLVRPGDGLDALQGLRYPLIVKPTDRSGSRGITEVQRPAGLPAAIARAREQSFEKMAVVEEFVTGQEYSVECVSYQGRHHLLQITLKYTTGAPMYIETGHMEPAPLSDAMREEVRRTVSHALDTLEIQNGASHSELKIDAAGRIQLIEIGGRMGGDCIGSHLVPYTTGWDYVAMVVQIALGQAPDLRQGPHHTACGVRFVFGPRDLELREALRADPDVTMLEESPIDPMDHIVIDSSTRFGYYIFAAEDPARICAWMEK